MTEMLELVGSILLALGGGSIIIFGLSKHLATLWAQRALELERATHAREHELLVRRRNVYTKLALSLRVFLVTPGASSEEEQLAARAAFLAAYDEAAVWASEEVIEAVSALMDMNVQHTTAPTTVPMEDYRAAYERCLVSMRRDSGFPKSKYRHRIVVF